MDIELIILIIVVFFLVLLSGFFSGSETSLTSASKARLHKLASEGDRRAKIVLKLRENKDSLIGAILLGNNVVNIVASMLAATVAAQLFSDGGWGIAIATFVMTMLILIFGEVMPKTYAFHNADHMAVKIAPIWNFLVKIFRPITKLVELIANFLLRVLGLSKRHEIVGGVDALRGAIDMHHSEGAVVKDDRDMLDSILDLSQIEVGEVMVHRRDTTTLDINDDPAKIIATAAKTGHTRLPVWEDEEENIIGILNTKNILRLSDKPTTEEIQGILHEPQFVPETTTLRDQLDNFREKRSHMAMVVDEYGALMGLVTLEDILEEIVGQIDDEHDKVIRGIKQKPDGKYVLRGNLSVRDVNRELGWDLPSDTEASTIAGFVISLAEKIPEVGEMFKAGNLQFKVLGKLRNQLTSVEVREIGQEEG